VVANDGRTRRSPRPPEPGEVAERRLARLALDIHDGPLQDVAALTADVAVLRQRLEAVVPEPAVEALRDVHARLSRVHADLRDLAEALQSRTLIDPPLREVLERLAETFGIRSDIELDVKFEGDLDDLTSSQRIAVARIVQEALSNVRDHSGATRATVSVVGGTEVLTIGVSDDGRGFDPATVEDGLRRQLHLGLVGMAQRAHLLNGTFSVTTQVGGPTSVEAAIPRWRPETAAA
jgi:signal transduction histidine kinase